MSKNSIPCPNRKKSLFVGWFVRMKPNKCVGLRCRLTQPTKNGQDIEK